MIRCRPRFHHHSFEQTLPTEDICQYASSFLTQSNSERATVGTDRVKFREQPAATLGYTFPLSGSGPVKPRQEEK